MEKTTKRGNACPKADSKPWETPCASSPECLVCPSEMHSKFEAGRVEKEERRERGEKERERTFHSVYL